MKQRQPLGFGKTFLASTLGMLVAGFIVTLLFVWMLTAALSSGFSDFGDLDKKPVIKENSILHLTFNSEIVDHGPHREFSFDMDGLEENGKQGLNQYIESIEHAKTNDKVKGIFLDLGFVNGGMATIEAIRNALMDFKTSKKFIIAYGEVLDQRAYYLATTADKIYLFSTGLIQHTGLSTELMFFKGMIDKLELDVSIIRGSGNKFKSAVEPFMYEKMSEPNRMQISRMQQVIWKQMLEGISKERNISVEKLWSLADSATIKNPASALENKMVDELVYRDQVIDILKTKSGIKTGKKLRLVGVGTYYKSFSEDQKSYNVLVESALNKSDKIAVIYASGNIVDGNGDHETIGSITLSKEIRRARLDKSVKAIVLRVNSPGGSALASEVIWRETQLAKKAKPFIVSMGDLAASGGYYISCGADKIYAETTTLTGSIGVFGILPHTERFFKSKTGITFDRVKTNRYADIGSTSRLMDDTEYKIIQQGVDDIYDLFTGRVATGRKMDQQLIKDSIGEGRIWMGSDALSLGLVDEIGGLNKAIKEAAKRAKVKEYIVKSYPEIEDPLKAFFEKLADKDGKTNENEDESKKSAETSLTHAQENLLLDQFKSILGEGNIKAYKQALNLLNTKGVKAQLPYFITNNW
jgi:protease IV